MDTNQLAKIAKALADPTRLQIYGKIAANPNTCCGEITEQQGLSPATISHHLKVLNESGLIECRREGQFVHSRVVPEAMREYTQALARMARPGKAERG